ncbi:MAG: Gfo/Idh/MocA family oxidoreductase [Planctomycetes bacterium]|nr:Gfo/Idh/MocA family oxidoreductase [Planctomycetota bacterium]
MSKNQVSRRGFVQTASATAALVGVTATAVSQSAPAPAQGANDRIRIGFVGTGGRGFGAHVKNLAELKKAGANIDLTAVCDVFNVQSDKAADYIKKNTATLPKQYVDYEDLLADPNVDAVCIGTPDHWHSTQAIAAMNAGKHVYCEKPMTKTVEQAIDIVDTWKSSGKVMQVGVQSTSLPVWDKARELINEGTIGKVLQFQTEFYRNSNIGQWRNYKLTRDMSPKNIDWQRWLGAKEGLATDRPFDRAVYRQWRRFFDFGAGMYTDLFVHRLTSMLKATGLRIPKRVVGAGGIFLEYDGREVPDVATVVADYGEGVQALISASMCNEDAAYPQLIRGHHGSLLFGNGEKFTGLDFQPERPQVTGIGSLHRDTKIRHEVGEVKNTTAAHFKNWLEAIRSNQPAHCNNPPDLGAAAVIAVILGARSYREGKVFFWDEEKRQASDVDPGWSDQWVARSRAGGPTQHVPGWNAGDKGSALKTPEWQSLEGPWIDGNDPAA